jgi:hypothetical protein
MRVSSSIRFTLSSGAKSISASACLDSWHFATTRVNSSLTRASSFLCSLCLPDRSVSQSGDIVLYLGYFKKLMWYGFVLGESPQIEELSPKASHSSDDQIRSKEGHCVYRVWGTENDAGRFSTRIRPFIAGCRYVLNFIVLWGDAAERTMNFVLCDSGVLDESTDEIMTRCNALNEWIISMKLPISWSNWEAQRN